MTERNSKERIVLGTIFLGISAFTFVMSITYIIKFMFFSEKFVDEMGAAAISTIMLYGALLCIGLNYTIRVPRGRENDFNQLVAGIVMIFLGTVIAIAMQMVVGVHEKYILVPVVFYAQNWLMLMTALYSLKLYKKKKI